MHVEYHHSKGGLLYGWGPQLKTLADLSGQSVAQVTDWIHRDYSNLRQPREVNRSLAAFVDHFLTRKEDR